LFGLVLVEFGVSRRWQQPRWQGYLALAGSLVRVFTANLVAEGLPGTISPRLYTIVPIALIFIALYFRLDVERILLMPAERRLHIVELDAWAALACFAGLVRFELQPDWVVVAWAALVPVLLAVSWRSQRLLFMHQALVLRADRRGGLRVGGGCFLARDRRIERCRVWKEVMGYQSFLAFTGQGE
jgi:hypothetical protein